MMNHWPHANGKHYDVLVLVGILLAAAILQARANIPTDFDVDEQLSKLNKPSANTIVTEDDVIDCVEIYKQPAFDHPLLKDHKIETSPTFQGSIESNKLNDSTEKFEQPWQKHGSCPGGTVPIKRVQRNDLLRARSTQSYGLNDDAYEDCTITSAIAESFNAGKFNGMEARLSVWKPYVIGKDWSLSSVTLLQDGDASFLRAGWMVNPVLFSDNNARVFVQWRNSSSRTGCINLCSGFVQTSTSFALGAAIQPVSEYNNKDMHITASIAIDDRKNWWVTIQNNIMGYFPAGLLPDFSATKTTWGGTICKRQLESDATEMGNGHFANEGWLKAALVRNMMVWNSDTLNFVSPAGLQFISQAPNCYTIMDVGKFDPSDIGPSIYFGGPGGNCSTA